MSENREPFRYEKLLIWHRSMALWERLQRETAGFPTSERYGLTSQIRRAACSVPSNIAEGYGKGTNLAFAAMVRHARGSVYELRTLIEGSGRFGYLNFEVATEILDELVELSKMIDSFLQRLERTEIRELTASYEIECGEFSSGTVFK